MKLDFWTRAVPTLIAILIGNNRLEGTNVGNKLPLRVSMQPPSAPDTK